jgi:hypothetical protein
MADQEDLGVLLSKIAVDVADLKKGLQDGRNELTSFKTMAEGVGAQVKKALTFTVRALGIGALLMEFKGLLQGVTEVGAKLETVKLASYAVGQNFGYTSSNIDLLVNDLKKFKVATSDAYEAVSQFISHGLDPRQLASIAQASRDLAVAAGKSPQEMFSLLVDSIVTGTPRALRQAKIPIKEFQDSVLAEGKSLDDNLKLSAQERSQVMIDLIMKYAQTVQGVSESTAGSYSRQLGQIKYMANQAKEVLWDFMQPLLTAITGEKIKVWSDLLGWLTANRAELQKWGQTIGEFIRMVWGMIAAVIAWVVANGDLLKTFVELAVLFKLSGYIIALGTAIRGAVPALYALATGATVVKAAFGGWLAILIQVLVALASLGAYKIAQIAQEKPSVARSMLMGEAEFVQSDQDRAAALAEDRTAEAREKARSGVHKSTEEKLKDLTPEQQKQYQELQSQLSAASVTGNLDKQVQDAMAKWKDMFGDKAGGGKGGGKGATGAAEDLFGEYLKVREQLRQVEIQDAQSSLDLLKATNEKKKAEMDKDLAEGLIDGQTYYARLREMESGETAAALALIDKKRQAQIKAHEDALADLARQEMSPEMAGYRRQEEDSKKRMALAQLAAEAAKVKLDGEKKVTEELKKQFEIQKQFKQKVEDLELATAWGPIEEQEAKLQQLYLDWQRAKAEAIQQGVSPELLARMETAYGRKTWNAGPQAEQAAGMASAITQWFSSAVDAIMQGGQDLKKTLNGLFKAVFTEAMKPGLKELQQLLMNGFKELFGAAGSAVGSAIMGVIGLIGMLLTSGGSNSSFTSSGVQSAVTGHEAVRGIIAGETSIPIAQIGDSLKDALVETNGILLAIEGNTRGGGSGAAGPLDVRVTIQGIEEAVNAAMERYFQNYLMLGARS